jgi:uncharacterized membrane protein YfcA
MQEALLVVASVMAGAIAAVTGFGIGSLLTPVFGLVADTRLAVAAVSIPHLLGTAFRFWRLGHPVDRRVLLGFGAASAAGGLTGALLHSWANGPALSVVFGGLLLFSGVSEWLGWSQRMRFTGAIGWLAGALSGLLGGLVGNQGGIRSAALLGFDLDRKTFVATATAVGLVVDAARMPLYLWHQSRDLNGLAAWIGLASIGVIVGTVIGGRVLTRIPEARFRPVVAGVLAVLGLWMLGRGFLQGTA